MLETKPKVGSCPVCRGLGDLTATDIFCGAGGSSLGLESVCCRACGRQLIKVTQGLNHWDLAVEAHNANFPDADHDVHDVQVIQASRFRRTDILWASPECTHHAYCRGPKSLDPEADRSRATFRDIVRFTDYHYYDAVIVENVIEARLWCDIAAHGDRCSCGSAFNDWYKAMCMLGYEGKIIYFNSQFALPTPQSRDRMYVVFWRIGLPVPQLDFRPESWCSTCHNVVRGIQTWKPTKKGTARAHPGMHQWGRYGAQYLYSCPDCHSAVAPAVVGARAIIDPTLKAQRIGDRDKDLATKTRERIRHGIQRLSTLDPVAVQVGGHLFERRPGVRVWSINSPLRTVHGTAQMAVVTPGESLVVRVGGQNGNGRGISEPMQTVIGSDRQIGVVTPPEQEQLNLLVQARRSKQNATTSSTTGEPAGTVTGTPEAALVIPNREHAVGSSIDEPGGTVTTAPAQHMLVQVNRGDKKGEVRDRSQAIDEPTRTIAGHGELAIVEIRNHGSAHSLDEPGATVCGTGNHHGLLVYNGVPGFVRSLDDAAGTLTSRDKQSLLVPYYSTGVAHPIDEPTSTITSKDREALVVTEADVDDCLFRMLQWHELLRAQAPYDHVDGRPYELTARRKDARTGKMKELSNELRVKMIGNMVSSPVATMLGAAIVESLAA